MSAHYVPQPLERTTVLLTPEQRAVLAADSATTGRPMGQLLRNLVDDRYFRHGFTIFGWRIALVKAPRRTPEAPPPPRARLREWISRLGSRA